MIETQERQRVVGIYTRISVDEDHDRLAVSRQAEDGRRDLERHPGMRLHDIYEDDDISGSGDQQRDDFERMLTDLRTGVINTVWGWDIDRFFRGLKEFVAFVDLCEQTGALVLWPSGSADFTTGEGIDDLEFRAMMARVELRKLKRRVRRRMVQNAEMGKWHGGGDDPYGYRKVLELTPNGKRRVVRLEVIPEEAEVIRFAAKEVLGGATLHSVVHALDAKGALTKRGKRWNSTSLKNTLTKAYISGRREHAPLENGKPRHRRGRITAEDCWPAIIDAETSDRLRSLLLDPGRDRRTKIGSNLLAGLIACGNCHTRMVMATRTKRRRYVCRSGNGFWGCGGTSVEAERAEQVVTDRLFALEEEGRLQSLLLGDMGDAVQRAQRDLEQVRALMRGLGARRAQGVPEAELEGERDVYRERERRALDVLHQASRRVDFPELQQGLRTAWQHLSVERRRALISAALSDRILVHPPQKRGQFDADRLEVHWKD